MILLKEEKEGEEEKEEGEEEEEEEKFGARNRKLVTCILFSVSSERFFLLIENLSHQLVGWAHHDITVENNLTNAARYT